MSDFEKYKKGAERAFNQAVDNWMAAKEENEKLRAENERLKLIISSGEAVVNDACNQADARLHAEVEADKLRARIAELEANAGHICEWTYDSDGYWEGTCGIAWALESEGPTENDMHFCPKCGKRLVAHHIADEVME
jgi:regulator of replication initiation timing